MINAGSAQSLARNEELKVSSPCLSGAIAQALADSDADHFSRDDYEFLKFHGVYQQDDRDLRKTGKHYMLMVRTKFPGGVVSAPQYLACDRLATQYGNNSLRITTRQDFQFHGILKTNLRSTIQGLHQALVSTLAACGDVERNVMASPTPATSPLVETILAQAQRLSEVFCPTTPAYHRIWIDGQELNLEEPGVKDFVDPLYGKSYLPRKFKTAFAIPPVNDIDIFTHDLGFVAIVEGGRLAGYNVLAGGGMGRSHNNPATYPRLADVLGFIPPAAVEAVARAVLTVHRDFGGRTDRKHARLKYVFDDRGVDWCRSEIERRAGLQLEPARPFEFTCQGDRLGWHAQSDGRLFLGLFVENGRVKDLGGYELKTALREVIEQFQPEVRLTASQNLLLTGIAEKQREAIDGMLRARGVSAENPYGATRRASMACPALPTCGLALAESERFMPDFITDFESLLSEVGLAGEAVIIRMTGCPNGCTRPYLAEIGLVGKGPNRYQLYLGGNEAGTRMNRLYREEVRSEQLLEVLRPLLERYREERRPRERFGDFCHRVLVNEAEIGDA